MMRDMVRAGLSAVLAAAVLAGCSSPSGSGTDTGRNGDGAPPKAAGSAAAEKGSRLGGAGSACALPVTFDLAADWKPEAVTVEPGSDLAALGEQGPVTLVCEIDAKPAGNIGYIRVWQGKPSDTGTRAVLEAFVAGEPNAAKASYTEGKAGAVAATEVTYTVSGELLDGPKTERAFAVATPGGPVVVHLGGLDSQEHRQMLPAYELAKGSLKLG
ncbi:lipoprotein [Streptomyces sp. B1I3]|uniref:lipoprotein n=1 Tax=Streptomyces sp. B1I3 TaxID=3042264 RepID=UPI00278AE527|nr:lipoprotein [Streptomyces sp. B1I3]MDQ0795894.1 ABC-type phosphate transport system substrate-binding protein [Streptomyces sp. B1I3]